MQALLGIDLGTTGVKAALFATDDGHVLSSAFVDYPLMHPHPGWAEQDPDDWWHATITAIRSCLAGGVRHGIASMDIRGVGLSGQMHGVVLLDAQQQVLRPCIIWADQRSDAQCRWMTERVGAARLIELVSNPALSPVGTRQRTRNFRPGTHEDPAEGLHPLPPDWSNGDGDLGCSRDLPAGCETGQVVA